MSLKGQVLSLLDEKKGSYLSGESIATILSVSRNAVWKVIKILQSDGHNIIASTNKGYSLAKNSDVLSEVIINKLLENKMNIQTFKTLTSTNTYLKALAAKGEDEGTVIICEEQTAGRGRMGRQFFSPANTGIYMSILLKPNMLASNAVLITTLAAVAVCEAIKEVSNKEAQIKWVNDIFIDDKKVCGILTEASISMENSRLEYVVLGIGVNVFSPKDDFPDNIKHIAKSILDESFSDIRNRLTAQILNRVMFYYNNFDDKLFIKEYINRSCVIGKNVTVIEGNNTYNALALDIDNECKLKIRTEDNTEKFISSGEISIRIVG